MADTGQNGALKKFRAKELACFEKSDRSICVVLTKDGSPIFRGATVPETILTALVEMTITASPSYYNIAENEILLTTEQAVKLLDGSVAFLERGRWVEMTCDSGAPIPNIKKLRLA